MLFAMFITGNLSRYCDLLYNTSLSLFPFSFPPLSIPLSFHASSIQCDMDERSNQLIGAHGYCTQVHLLGDVQWTTTIQGTIVFVSYGLLTRFHTIIRRRKCSKHPAAFSPPLQEMVNLLLTGVAVSNVFDGNVELDSGGTTTVRWTTVSSVAYSVKYSAVPHSWRKWACGGCLCQKCSNFGEKG